MFNSAYNYNKSSGVFAGAGLQARGARGGCDKRLHAHLLFFHLIVTRMTCM